MGEDLPGLRNIQTATRKSSANKNRRLGLRRTGAKERAMLRPTLERTEKGGKGQQSEKGWALLFFFLLFPYYFA